MNRINHQSDDSFKKLDFEDFEKYHSNFKGDTYDACQDCGGKCEKYAICTLIPGEKEYLSKKLNLKIEELENRYLDCFNTPFGKVDVIKMKNNCPWLDENFNCTIKDVKPILCDSYPIICCIENEKLKFEIDNGCPCSNNKKYENIIGNFREKGILALKKIGAPLEWWKTVEYYDGYDFDYLKIEDKLRKTKDYQEFYLEEILGFACEDGEIEARNLGLDLIEIRLEKIKDNTFTQLRIRDPNKYPFTSKLLNSYGERIESKISKIKTILNEARENKEVFDKKNLDLYLLYIKKMLFLINQIREYTFTYIKRSKEFQKLEVSLEIDCKSKFFKKMKISSNSKDFSSEFSVFSVENGNCKDFLEAYILLIQDFDPNELDGPIDLSEGLNGKFRYFELDSSEFNISDNLNIKNIALIVKNKQDRVIGIGDGAIISNKEYNLFYLSHISIVPKYRTHGIGTNLNKIMYEYVKNELDQLKLIKNSSFVEISEVEFPNEYLNNIESIKRLSFHGKMKRFTFWPLLYAQPDTNYSEDMFIEEKWNSVPMFLCFKHIKFSSSGKKTKPSSQFDMNLTKKLINLYFNYFYLDYKEGSEWDRRYIFKNLNTYKTIKQIKFPVEKKEIQNFIDDTGWASELLIKYYPNHKFTKDRKEIIFLYSKTK